MIASDGLNTVSDQSDAPFVIKKDVLNGKIAFTQHKSPYGYRIWTMNADGSNAAPLPPFVPGAGSAYFNGRHPNWSPDGSKIVFWGTQPVSPTSSIYVMNADGSQVTKLLDDDPSGPNLYRCPQWSHDGSNILLFQLSIYDVTRGLWLMNADGSNLHQVWSSQGSHIVPENSYLSEECPSWSPDDTRVIFKGRDDRGPYISHLYVMSLDGSNLIALPNTSVYDKSPAWSPDGSQIAFTHSQSHPATTVYTDDLWVMNSDGSGQRLVHGNTWTGYYEPHDLKPYWSPDGMRIIFSHGNYNQMTWGVYAIDVDGANMSLLSGLTDLIVDNNFMSWQPIRTPDPADSVYIHADAGSGYTTREGSPVLLSAAGSSAAASITSYSWDLNNDGVYSDALGLTTTLTLNSAGNYPIGLIISDTLGQVNSASAWITVTDVAPQLSNVQAWLDNGITATLRADLYDPDPQDILTATVDWGDGSPASLGTIVLGSQQDLVLASHIYAAAGSYPIDLTASDNSGLSATVTATISLLPPNQPPTVNDETVLVPQNKRSLIPVQASDPDQDILAYHLISQPVHGMAVILPGDTPVSPPTVIYIPIPGYRGPDSFTIQADDGKAFSNIATINLSVTTPLYLPFITRQ